MKMLMIVLTFVIGIMTTSTFAAKADFEVTVNRLFTSNPDTFGGCMANVGRKISNIAAVDCTSYWVSFSCSGELNPKDTAYHMYDAAQLSLALGNTIRVWVDDTKKHNGHCVANRVDILKQQ